METTTVPLVESLRDKKIDNAGRISHVVFEVSFRGIRDHLRPVNVDVCQIVLGLFCGLAITTMIARLALRIMTRHKLYLDDFVLLLGLACLSAATYLIYTFSHTIFLSNAVRLDPSITLTLDEITQLINSLKIIYSFLALIWTTTYSVKLSFLIFFKKMISRVSKKIIIYYRIVIVITIIAWMFVVSEPFILCPYFGMKTGKSLLGTLCQGGQCADAYSQ